MENNRDRSFPTLVTDLVSDLALLVRKEGQLARSEVSEKVTAALAGIALLLSGAILLIPALVILLQAAIAGLVENGTSPAVAALIVGGAALLLGVVLALIGWTRLKPASLVPTRTLAGFERDVAVAQRTTKTQTAADKFDGREMGYDQPNRAA